jgi:hypothetical protein
MLKRIKTRFSCFVDTHIATAFHFARQYLIDERKSYQACQIIIALLLPKFQISVVKDDLFGIALSFE